MAFSLSNIPPIDSLKDPNFINGFTDVFLREFMELRMQSCMVSTSFRNEFISDPIRMSNIFATDRFYLYGLMFKFAELNHHMNPKYNRQISNNMKTKGGIAGFVASIYKNKTHNL